jgi:hypothetical protein
MISFNPGQAQAGEDQKSSSSQPADATSEEEWGIYNGLCQKVRI